jgi:choline-phosphate cytidylyltransferase
VGLGVKTEGNLVISGTRGYIYVPAPWWKTDHFELRYENPSDAEPHYYQFAGDGLRYELVEFLKQISQKRMDDTCSNMSKKIARIIENYRAGGHVRVFSN